MVVKKMVEAERSQSLSEYLVNIRATKKLTLREVEEATNHAVSNAYLSQLEHGRICKPSPNILYELANVYGVSYETLMEKAGYIATVEHGKHGKHGRVASFASTDLSQEEEEELLKYLAFLRSRKGRS